MALGSLLGGILLAELSRHYGEPFINWMSPGLLNSESWQLAESWIERHGVWALFLVAASPFAQQPSILLGGLTDMPLYEIAFALGTGRLIKFLTYAWIASHTPKLVKKIPALSGELEELEAGGPEKDVPEQSR
jgi:membrane protein YqaA with SNARE-associated domain